MFWNRKKEPAKDAPAATPAGGRTAIAPAGVKSAPTGSRSAAANPPSTIQFLTGDPDLDRRSVEVLLEAIARVSEARNLDELLVDIVDHSIEIAGAERGLLILAGKDAGNSTSGETGLTLRVARAKGGESINDDVRFSTSIVKRVLDQGNPV